MIEKYPASDSTMDGLSLQPMESKVYRVNYVEGLEQQLADQLNLLKRAHDYFKANYSYIFEDKEIMRLYGDIEEALKDSEEE